MRTIQLWFDTDGQPSMVAIRWNWLDALPNSNFWRLHSPACGTDAT